MVLVVIAHDCTAFVEVRKCDKFRGGSIAPFVDSGEVKGACNLLRVFLSLMPEGGMVRGCLCFE